jgi:hypothetical protein
MKIFPELLRIGTLTLKDEVPSAGVGVPCAIVWGL